LPAFRREEKQMMPNVNDTACEFPYDQTLHGLFERQVRKTPERPAVFFKDQRLSYSELDERANDLAARLRHGGVEPGGIVGLMLDRSLEMMVGIFGILKAGAAYMPIDPKYPRDRIDYMLADSNAAALLDGTLDAPRLLRPAPPGKSTLIPSFTDGASSLAYVIYTSGSTGKPKGVMIDNRPVVNRLHWMQKRYPLGEGDVILQKTPFIFDVSVWELFWWSQVGSSVCFLQPGFEKFPQAIVETVEKRNITTMHFVPSMLAAFLGYIEHSGDAKRMASLNRVFVSGEALKPAHVERFNKTLFSENNTHLINLYGPTEATVDVTYFDCPPGKELKSIPIGKPIDNVQAHILDENLQPLPQGTEGELCISGAALARGYLNRPALTAGRFCCLRRPGGALFIKSAPPGPPCKNFSLSKAGTDYSKQKFLGVQGPFFKKGPGRRRHPAARGPSKKIYRTGDMARFLGDGNIEFLGRMDHQVKIRGLRIELGEIESVLVRHPAVQDAAVLVKETSETIVNIVAYITLKPGLQPPDAELKKHMKSFLPDYMVPGMFVILDALPLTPTGKVDRKKLPDHT
jgi:surfactin family lipopeptide synthetase A